MPLVIWMRRLPLAFRSSLAALAFIMLALGSAPARASEDLQPPALVWGAVPDGDLYLLVASPRLSKPELQQLAADTIGPGIGDSQYITQVWSNRPEPIQLWVSIDSIPLREAGLSLDQALEALAVKLGIAAQPSTGIGLPPSWIYPGATREKLEAWSDAPPRRADGSVINPAAWTTLTYRQAPAPWDAWNKVALSIAVPAEADRGPLEGIVGGRLKAMASTLPEDVSILILPVGPRLNETHGIFVMLGPDG